MTITLKQYKGWDKDSNCAIYEEEILGEGTTVATFTQVERVMSDVYDDVRYAVYMGKDQKFHTVCVSGSVFTLDASMLVKVFYESWKEGEELGIRLRGEIAREDRRFAEYQESLEAVEKGKTVRVSRGRKVPLGTVGLVFWTGFDSWGKGKVGIALDDTRDNRGRYANTVWVATANCDVIRGDRMEEIRAYRAQAPWLYDRR